MSATSASFLRTFIRLHLGICSFFVNVDEGIGPRGSLVTHRAFFYILIIQIRVWALSRCAHVHCTRAYALNQTRCQSNSSVNFDGDFGNEAAQSAFALSPAKHFHPSHTCVHSIPATRRFVCVHELQQEMGTCQQLCARIALRAATRWWWRYVHSEGC